MPVKKTKKLDLADANRVSFAARKDPAIVDVPRGKFLAAEGTGDPGGEAFRCAIGAITGSPGPSR